LVKIQKDKKKEGRKSKEVKEPKNKENGRSRESEPEFEKWTNEKNQIFFRGYRKVRTAQ
jgi:hypothetical protein